MNFIHILKTFSNVTSSFKFGHPAVTCKTILWGDLPCAMDLRLVKPTDPFSAKCISMHKIKMVRFIEVNKGLCTSLV